MCDGPSGELKQKTRFLLQGMKISVALAERMYFVHGTRPRSQFVCVVLVSSGQGSRGRRQCSHAFDAPDNLHHDASRRAGERRQLAT